MSKEKIEQLERRLEKIERQSEIQKEVKRVIENEKSGLFKTIINLGKVIAALILLFTAGDQAMEYNWIKALIK